MNTKAYTPHESWNSEKTATQKGKKSSNTTFGLYHKACVAKQPKDSYLFVTDVNKWRDMDEYINTLGRNQLSNPEIIARIREKYQTSHTTAYRRLEENNLKFQ
ncbi:MAG: hypothetical protein PVF15_02865 [Candidatus Bathyarchaeota archaeon]